MTIAIKIFDMKVPTEKTKRGEFNTQEIMQWKKYGIYGEALKKGITEKQYAELAFIWDDLLTNLDHMKKTNKDNYLNNRVGIFGGTETYYLNLNRVEMWWGVKADKLQVTFDYVADNAEKLRKEQYHEIKVLDPENIEFHYGVPFKTVRKRTITQTPTQYERISDVYIIDAEGFIK